MSSTPEKSPAVDEVLSSLAAGTEPDKAALREAVRALLKDLGTLAPGRSVEVRVPPYGAIQCVEGPRHTRGTPANVVEMSPVTFVEIATGRTTWADAVRDGRISASGIRADISHLFPFCLR
ncbi:sterol carrier family protein [Catelliglobosispora koreensis]|uniref:sterol carrier family protein n=1 Tax=Catelliglobosispora koreensis TaxID=129052 RepID=UPI0009FFCA64|nr:sterol carrier family protein [Catelliglobosispora koreensis]